MPLARALLMCMFWLLPGAQLYPFICRDMLANIKRVAKKIQGSLPIVGLLSRLSAPGGGFDEIVSPSVQHSCCLRHASMHVGACWVC